MSKLPVPQSWIIMGIGFFLIIMSISSAFYLSGIECQVDAERTLNLPEGEETRESTTTLTGFDCASESIENMIISISSILMVFLGGSLIIGGFRSFFRGN